MIDPRSAADLAKTVLYTVGDLVSGRNDTGAYVVGNITGVGEGVVTIDGITVHDTRRGSWTLPLERVLSHVRFGT